MSQRDFFCGLSLPQGLPSSSQWPSGYFAFPDGHSQHWFQGLGEEREEAFGSWQNFTFLIQTQIHFSFSLSFAITCSGCYHLTENASLAIKPPILWFCDAQIILSDLKTILLEGFNAWFFKKNYKACKDILYNKKFIKVARLNDTLCSVRDKWKNEICK